MNATRHFVTYLSSTSDFEILTWVRLSPPLSVRYGPSSEAPPGLARLSAKSKYYTGAEAEVVLNIGCRVEEIGAEISSINDPKAKMPGEPEIETTAGFDR